MSENSIPPPPPPEPPPAPAPVVPTPPSEGTGLAPNIAAGIAALFPPVGGIVMLVLEKRDAFVRFHAMQSLVFGAAMVVFGIVSTILNLVLVHIPILGWLIMILLGLLSMLISLGALVVWLLAAFKAFNGVEWEIPFVGKFARQQLAKTGSLGPLA